LGLATNRLFVGAVPITVPFFGDTAGVIFTRSIIQFFNDDLSELYSDYNATAAQVFGTVLRSQFGVIHAIFGTQKPGAIAQLLPAQ
jgi:hypothetical protein